MKMIPEIQTMADSPQKMGWLVHALVWITLFAFPFLFREREAETINMQEYLRFFIMMFGPLVVFYANYSFFVQRFLFSRRFWLFLLCNLLLFIVTFIANGLLFSLTLTHEVIRAGHLNRSVANLFIVFDAIKYIFLMVLSIALKATNSWYRIDTERKELEKQRSEAELQNLKNQLNPHFLFNTLNNIYSLIAIDGAQAQTAIHELSRLLRYMLYDSSQEFVPLEKDMDFVRNYVELMRIRMPAHVELKTEIQIEKPDTLIAPLLFISLVENAFKHGVSNSRPSFIHIEIIADKNKISCLIKNSFFPKDEQDKSGSGIGLVNLKKRLDLLYPDNYELTCKQTDEMYSCTLTLIHNAYPPPEGAGGGPILNE